MTFAFWSERASSYAANVIANARARGLAFSGHTNLTALEQLSRWPATLRDLTCTCIPVTCTSIPVPCTSIPVTCTSIPLSRARQSLSSTRLYWSRARLSLSRARVCVAVCQDHLHTCREASMYSGPSCDCSHDIGLHTWCPF